MTDLYSKGSNYLVSTSRGKYTTRKFDELDKLVVSRSLKGAKLVKLVDEAISLVEQHRRQYTEAQWVHKDIVTIVGGLPNITHMKFGRGYQEVIYEHWQQDQYKDHLENLKLSFLEAAERLEKINTIPVFATIAPFHIKTWNNFRLKIGATRYLNHAQEYPLMQRKINKLIPEMNNFIRSLNSKHEPSLATPDLAKFNIKSGGKSRPYDIGYEGMDLDGCHPNDPAKCLKGRKLVNDWYTELDLKMSKNRMTTASEKAIRISMGH